LVILGEREEALGQAWRLPSPETATTREFVGMVFEEVGKPARLQAAPKIVLWVLGLFNPPLRETIEMLYAFEADWAIMSGLPYIARPVYGLRKPKNAVRGTDVAGTVEAAGTGVTRLRPGDEVFGWCSGLVCRLCDRLRREAGAEACQPQLRTGCGRSHGRFRRPPGPSRSWRRSSRAEGPDQRRLRRHRHLRGAETSGLYFDIDLVLRDTATGEILCVLDTKYKDTTTPATDDVAQIVAYAE
jgi:hypothetical protein